MSDANQHHTSKWSATPGVGIDDDIMKKVRSVEGEYFVYRIVAMDKSGTAVTIHRVGGVDSDGVLYIGRGNRQRLRQLVFP